MKKHGTKLLVIGLASLFTLVGCGEIKKPAPDIQEPPIDESDEPTYANVLTSEILSKIQGNVALKGFANEKYGEKADNITDIDVSYTSDSYHYVGFDNTAKTTNEGRIYKIAGVPTIMGINAKNELVCTELKDKSGEIESWSKYVNPFKELTLHDFVKDEETVGLYHLRLGTETEVAFAQSMMSSLTRYVLTGILDISFVIEKDQFKSISVETDVGTTVLGSSRFLSTLEFVKFGDEVKSPEYPTPFVHKAEHDKLGEALKKINKGPFNAKVEEVNTVEGGNWDEAEIIVYDCSYSSTLTYVYDGSYKDGQGTIVQDGKAYTFKYKKDVYTRNYFPNVDKDGKDITSISKDEFPDFEYLAPELFTVKDDKHFTYDGTFAGTAAYYYAPNRNPFAKSCTQVEITLDDNYEVKTIFYTDVDFSKVTATITGLGETYVAPFALDQLVVPENPMLKFYGKFTGKTYKGDEHTVVIKEDGTCSFDDKVGKDLTYDKNRDKFTFKAGTYSVSVSYYSSSKKYSISASNDKEYISFSTTEKLAA